jgi:hypothetical protein
VEVFEMKFPIAGKWLHTGSPFHARLPALSSLAIAATLAAALLLGGCTPSMVYSPSVNLPPEPLKAKQVQILGGVVEMPEVRPGSVPEKTARGVEFTARVGAADWLMIQAKAWKDISDNIPDAERYGVSVSTILAERRDLGGFRVGLMPSVVFVCDEMDWYGAGATLPLCVWLPDLSVLHPYAALGPGYGAHDTKNNEWGWCMIGNCGCAAVFARHFVVNAELSTVQAFNKYDKRNDSFLAWSVNGGLLF